MSNSERSLQYLPPQVTYGAFIDIVNQYTDKSEERYDTEIDKRIPLVLVAYSGERYPTVRCFAVNGFKVSSWQELTAFINDRPIIASKGLAYANASGNVHAWNTHYTLYMLGEPKPDPIIVHKEIQLDSFESRIFPYGYEQKYYWFEGGNDAGRAFVMEAVLRAYHPEYDRPTGTIVVPVKNFFCQTVKDRPYAPFESQWKEGVVAELKEVQKVVMQVRDDSVTVRQKPFLSITSTETDIKQYIPISRSMQPATADDLLLYESYHHPVTDAAAFPEHNAVSSELNEIERRIQSLQRFQQKRRIRPPHVISAQQFTQLTREFRRSFPKTVAKRKAREERKKIDDMTEAWKIFKTPMPEIEEEMEQLSARYEGLKRRLEEEIRPQMLVKWHQDVEHAKKEWDVRKAEIIKKLEEDENISFDVYTDVCNQSEQRSMKEKLTILEKAYQAGLNPCEALKMAGLPSSFELQSLREFATMSFGYESVSQVQDIRTKMSFWLKLGTGE